MFFKMELKQTDALSQRAGSRDGTRWKEAWIPAYVQHWKW